MASFYSIRGTTQPNFQFGKSGPILHQATSAPSGGTGSDGDFFIQHGGTFGIFQKLSGTWVQLQSSLKVTQTKSANYTTIATDEVIFVDSSGGVVAITLGTAATLDGKPIVIKDIGNAAATNNITIDTEAAQTIEGSASILIANNRESISLISDGTDWHLI